MKILAIDTATDSCSVAVADDSLLLSGFDKGILAEITLVSKQTHSKHLMGIIRQAIEISGLTIHDIDGFAVARGPGSFTGLRIGISVVKGLAAASGKPVVGVSNLDALAFQFPFSSCLICVLLDARKKEVYSCCYRFENRMLKKLTSDQVLSPEKAISDIKEPCLFVGNGAWLYQKVIQDKLGDLACFVPQFQNMIRAATIAYLSVERFKQGNTDNPVSLTPHYIRKSDAQLGFGM